MASLPLPFMGFSILQRWKRQVPRTQIKFLETTFKKNFSWIVLKDEVIKLHFKLLSSVNFSIHHIVNN